MAKGKGDKPASFEIFMAELHKRRGGKYIPSRSDWNAYPKYRLEPIRSIKKGPRWMQLLTKGSLLFVTLGLIIYIAINPPTSHS